jgi:glycosyltransferase involved in cell wall biosynthesis
MRVLLLSCDNVVPASGGATGSEVIRWGLINGLLNNGALPSFYVAGNWSEGKRQRFQVGQDALSGIGVQFRYDQPSKGAAAIESLRLAVDNFRPDVILAYGAAPLRLAREAAPEVLAGIMSVDLEYLPVLHRYWFNLRYGRMRTKMKSAVLTPYRLMSAANIAYEVRRDYRIADFVINHAAHHADWHRSTHRRPTLYVPNPVAALGERPVRRPVRPARFLMIGAIHGIATLTGLAWFAKHVYPLLEPAILQDKMEIHLIGKGEIEPSIGKRMPKVVRRGFVENLADEFAAATAVLVPTPITLGFRTRIVEAFSHGVTVVAHEANAVGMPELADGGNALIAASGLEFAEKCLRLVERPAEAERLGNAASHDFSSRLNADLVAKKIIEFIKGVQQLRPAQRAA